MANANPITIVQPRRRLLLEALVEAAIAELDAMDGDADLEPQCEDEGAQCEDEGADEHHCVAEYGIDQTRLGRFVRWAA